MSYALVRVKWGLGGINVHDGPDGKIIDAIEPHGVHIQTVGAPMIMKRGVDWVEVMYSRPHTKPERGWVAERCVDIAWQTIQGTVHDAQIAYEKSVSFPKPPDIPRIELPECAPVTPRGLWVVLAMAVLCVFGLLFKAYLHIH